MTAITINSTTATILDGNYIGVCATSCATIDRPTKERVTVILDGTEYERTVYERIVWRNQGENTLVARFVWIGGKFYAIDQDQADEPTDHGFAWVWNSNDQLCFVDGNGRMIVKGAFNEYELFGFNLDGSECRMTVRADSYEDAGAIFSKRMAKLGAGWRPVNW